MRIAAIKDWYRSISHLPGTYSVPSSGLDLDAHANGPGVCSFFGPTNLVRSGVSPLGILALDTLQRGRRLAERGPGDSPL